MLDLASRASRGHAERSWWERQTQGAQTWGTIAANGVTLVNWGTFSARARSRWTIASAVWGVVALMVGVPSSTAFDVSLPLPAGLLALAWVGIARLLRRKARCSRTTAGWLFVAYSVVLLFWRATFLRMV
ncbi:hypothetical protein [Lentzea californiensis]|uniref:hypothetical protein n=1 Tax=Lentzea californiensis TaxID=438851 RepID=UPI0021657F5E|nr:hypothetical protein [Lentzea californiensis]MCR3752182.1 hypothetical protein [Lentzea californiensis]